MRDLLGTIVVRGSETTLRKQALMLLYGYPAVLGRMGEVEGQAERADARGFDPSAENREWKEIQKRLQLAEKGA